MKFVRKNGYYNCSLGIVSLNQINMVEQVLLAMYWEYIFCAAKTFEERDLVDYRRPFFILFIFLRWMETVDNIPCLTDRERVYGDELNENIRLIRLRPEQTSKELIKTLINMYIWFSYPFTVSYETKCACRLLPEHRRCILGDK